MHWPIEPGSAQGQREIRCCKIAGQKFYTTLHQPVRRANSDTSLAVKRAITAIPLVMVAVSRLQFLGTCRSRTNADDRLPRAALGRVEGGDGLVEGRDVADVRPQSSVTHPLDDLTQLGTIGLDNEVDRQAVGGPHLGRPDDGHQCSSGSNHACGPLLDVAADDIEHQIDPADGEVNETDRGKGPP